MMDPYAMDALYGYDPTPLMMPAHHQQYNQPQHHKTPCELSKESSTTAKSVIEPAKQAASNVDHYAGGKGKVLTSSFTDFDDEPSALYLARLNRAASMSGAFNQAALRGYPMLERRQQGADEASVTTQKDTKVSNAGAAPSEAALRHPSEDLETYDGSSDATSANKRVKRQAYETSSYEPPCRGFPLEINIKSRIKFDQIFPIKGNSQIKKCVRFE